MIERDWTPTDAAEAADDQRDREWWKRDPYAGESDPDEMFICEVCGEHRSESDMDSQILASHPTFKCVCSDCADPIIIQWGIA